ncbi:PaaX family transcriptional regulator C-terminal domain-containing protein [Streptomyces sp. NPDC046985]|uniref:PaaX family transcriptional regulator C-terminal domain-containing protein n=1 Tax=Streptomyces sp. NPDC046985 TaxID=3155377 RepID=UPI0033E1EF21
MNAAPEPAQIELRPLSARSVVLSLLLGVHPPELPVRDLVRAVEPLGIGASALRAALSRMTAAGDLRRSDGVYGLSERLLERQRRQDAAVHPRTRPWDGAWEMGVVTTTGRGPAERAALRARLTGLRLAELREGVWLRPANLRRPWPDGLGDVILRFTARPGDARASDAAPGGAGLDGIGPDGFRPDGLGLDGFGLDEAASPADGARELAAGLWPLGAWAATARALLAHVERAKAPADRFTALAAVVRHLLADPVLPAELLPANWPGPALRTAYTDYRRELTEEMLGRTGR